MDHFFTVMTLDEVMALVPGFHPLALETIPVSQALARVLARDITADQDMPGFRRATMDGYAVSAPSTFGASESSPAWLKVIGNIPMGLVPEFRVEPGQAARIATGGMLPEGADAVVMIEHTEQVDDATIEAYKSVAPLQNVIDSADDFRRGQTILEAGTRIRPQEAGLAAALGIEHLTVFRQPRVAIISTGDEIVDIHEVPGPGKIRDINSYTLAGLVSDAGALPRTFGIVRDNAETLTRVCRTALEQTDMVLISGGSSVGTRDFTQDVLSRLDNTRILLHGISISPGKPTLLAACGNTPVWGLPGHVVSAMIVFRIVVLPFLNRLRGLRPVSDIRIPARLTRNVASAPGRTEFVRVRLARTREGLWAEPVLGKSGLIRTMILADGLLEIGHNTEGVEKGTLVEIIPL